MSGIAQKTITKTIASSTSHQAPRLAAYRSAAPGVERVAVLRPAGTVRRMFTTPEELDMAAMLKAVRVALAIDRRMPPDRGPAGVGGKWPLPTTPDEKPDDIEGERRAFMNKPKPPTSMEISFMDDVAELLARLADDDLLGAKLVAGRAKGMSWARLAVEDIQNRKRTMLCYLWRNALHKMVGLDRLLRKNVVDRVNKSA